MNLSVAEVQKISELIGVVSPLAVAYVTKSSWSSRVKTILNLGITTLGTVVAGVIFEPGMSVGSYFDAIVRGCVTAFVAHIAWSKTGVTDKVADKGVTDKHQTSGKEYIEDYDIVNPDELEDGDQLDADEEEAKL